jgi:GNAT superfamily N-acetyltransferase
MTETSTATLAISALDGRDPAAVEAAYQIVRTARAHDIPDLAPPCRHRFGLQFTNAWPGYDMRYWIAHDGPTVLGYLELDMSTMDNLESGSIDVTVAPENRRRGIGTALYHHGVEFLRGQGRTRAFGFVPEGTAGAAFGPAVGLTNAMDDVRRRLDLSTVDEAEHDELLADAWGRAAGYSVVTWTTRAPGELVDDIARLDSRLLEDAPRGDLQIENERIDADRIRATEQARITFGIRSYSAAAVHDATGRAVAITAISQAHGRHDHADQLITLVDPDHRGHRLGLIVKLENFRAARAGLPALRYIDTYNAAANHHMIAINEIMGFRVREVWLNLQHEFGA